MTAPGSAGKQPEVTNLLWVLRLLMAVHVLIALAQAVSAGMLLDGDGSSALRLHQLTGTSVITTVSVLQVVVAVLCWRRHQHSAWLALGSAGLFATEMVQIGLGFTDQVALHVPIGASILAAAVLLLFASLKHFGPTPGRRRGLPKRA